MALTVSVGVWLLTASAPALAARTYVPGGSFGSAGTGAGQFASPQGVAVDQATGDVYVADAGNFRVEKFSASGQFLAAWGWGVSDGASSSEVCTNSCQAGISGSGPGQFSDPIAVAVDNSNGPSAGDIYVADQSNDVVEKFDSAGQYLSSITGPNGTSFNTVIGVATDPSGNVWVYDQTGKVSEFDDTGATVGSWTSGTPTTTVFTVDAADNIYAGGALGSGSTIEKFTSNGTDLAPLDDNITDATAASADLAADQVFIAQGTFVGVYSGSATTPASPLTTIGSFGDATGVAVDSAAGTVYVADSSANQVDVFTPVAVPDLTVGAASSIGQTNATVTGTVNPDGMPVTSCQVEYGTTTTYGQSAPCTPTPAAIGSGTGAVAVSANLSDLQPGTVYHFRLDAGNANGANDGADHTFLTDGAGILSFSNTVTNQDGTPATQAGTHPYAMTTTIELSSHTDPSTLKSAPDANLKDVEVALPPGFIGNPTGIPQCTVQQLSGPTGFQPVCSPASQVGVVTLSGTPVGTVHFAVYNMVPPPGHPAEFGFNALLENVYITISIRTGGDYGVTASLPNIPTALPFSGTSLTLWGVPADPSHDAQRCNSDLLFTDTCSTPESAGIPPQPLLTNPTSCSGPQTTTLQADSWQSAGSYQTATSISQDAQGDPIGLNGCDLLGFSPTITVQPGTNTADSPTGLSIDLHMPQDGLTNPTGLAEADLKNATVTLPAGVSVNPSAANGLTACTPAQIGIDNADEPACPDSSKIGTLEVDTPLLSDPLTGGIYVAQQNQNPFGSLLAIYVTAEADGVLVKLAGHVVADPVTGQLTTTFSNNPQLPFTDFKLDFFGGPQGILATPQQLGTYTTTADLSSWAGGPDATLSDPLQITSGAVSGFTPTFTAGTQNAQAGAYAPFVLSFQRSDTDQNLSGLTIKLPPGMLAKLAGVQECSEAQLAQASANSGAAEQANPSCPAGSQVGTVTTGAGVGPDPYYIQGKAYLTGPYKGAPYGIAVVVPAVAGPYDLGTVVVRQALEINPTTAQVTDVSDPFPSILDGIPLRIRSVSVDLNRPDFTVNPTSCNPMSLTGALTSTGGLTYNADSHFQVGGCQDIGFSPKLKIGLSGKGQTKSGDHPTLTATLTDRSGQANLRSAKVTLPLSMALDPNNSNHVCAYATAAAVHGGAVGCSARTIVGKATAITPLLSKPLAGEVYLVQGLRCQTGRLSQQGTCPNGKKPTHTLPTLLVPLRGQIALDLRAKSSVNGAGALVTTFSTIPDAPVSKFTLQITGGKKGLLVITGRGQTICGKPQVASENLGAQSGKSMVGNDTLTTPCKAVKKSTKAKSKAKGRV